MNQSWHILEAPRGMEQGPKHKQLRKVTLGHSLAFTGFESCRFKGLCKPPKPHPYLKLLYLVYQALHPASSQQLTATSACPPISISTYPKEFLLPG